jgi:hypothetical protein
MLVLLLFGCFTLVTHLDLANCLYSELPFEYNLYMKLLFELHFIAKVLNIASLTACLQPLPAAHIIVPL